MRFFVVLLLMSANVGASEIMSGNGVVVTDKDVLNYLKAAVPEERRIEFLSSDSALVQLVENLYVIRRLAAKAGIEVNYDEEELKWQLDLEKDRYLMERFIQKSVMSTVKEVDLDAMAREEYIANREEYRIPERVKAKHILININGDEDEARKELETIRSRVIAGEEFTPLAVEYSDDPSAKVNGGDLGYFEKGKMAQQFEEVAFSIQPGEISDIFMTKFGYHFLVVDDKKEEGYIPFEDAKDSIKTKIEKKIKQNAHQALIREIKAEQNIKVKEENFKSLLDAIKKTN